MGFNISIKDKIILILFLLAEVKLFYIFRMPSQLAKPGSPAFCAILSVIFFVVYLIKKHKLYIERFGKIILSFLAYTFIELIVAILQFPNQTFWGALSWVFQYCVLLFYFPLVNKVEHVNDYYQWAKKTICIFALLLSSLLIAECVAYNLLHLHILNIYGITYGEDAKVISRIGSTTLRLYGVTGAIVPLSILISFDNLLKNRCSMLFNLMCIFSGLICLYYVTQGRVSLLCIVVCLIVMFLYGYKGKITSRKLAMIALGNVVVILFIWGLSNYFQSLYYDIYYSNDSYSIRLDEISHYIGYFYEYPLFGTGLLTDSSYSYILQGPLGTYGVDDVGIFGILFRFGIVGIILYLVFGVSMTRQSLRAKSSLCIAIALHFWMSCFTLSYFDLGRVILLLLSVFIIKIDCQSKLEN